MLSGQWLNLGTVHDNVQNVLVRVLSTLAYMFEWHGNTVPDVSDTSWYSCRSAGDSNRGCVTLCSTIQGVVAWHLL